VLHVLNPETDRARSMTTTDSPQTKTPPILL
jgi:hypothetical protein